MGVDVEQFAEQDITRLSELIWDSILGLKIHRAVQRPEDLAPRETLVGSVHITGRWHGAVTLECPVSLARKMAGIMFGLDEKDTTLDLSVDALGEIINMTGGNIKASLLPGLSELSLPTVRSGDMFRGRMPDTCLVTRLDFACLDEPVVVKLLEKNSPPTDTVVN